MKTIFEPPILYGCSGCGGGGTHVQIMAEPHNPEDWIEVIYAGPAHNHIIVGASGTEYGYYGRGARINILKVDQAQQPQLFPVVEVNGSAEVVVGEGSVDFTVLEGIGQVGNQKLHASGITTFAALASQNAEALAAILGSPTTVEKSQQIISAAAQK